MALKLTSTNKFSKNQLIVFGLLFALIGGIVIWRSLALNPNLPGDVNNDNVVNITDMSILLSNYGTNYSAADFNSSELVDITDLSILLTNYNKTYTPPPASGQTYTLVDFETGDLSQWHGGISNINAWKILQTDGSVTPSKGKYMAKITLPAGSGASEAGTRGAPPPDNAWSNDRWEVADKIGKTDYFSFSFYFPLDWPGATTYQANAGIAQLGFNGLANTTLQIHNQSPVSSPKKVPGSLELLMLTGKVTYPGEGIFPDPGSATFQPGTQTYEYNTANAGLGPYFTGYKIVPESRYQLGVWNNIVLAVTWNTGSNGRVQAWHKRKGVDTSWYQTLDIQNVPTLSWGWGASGTNAQGNYMDSKGYDRYGNKFMAINKVGPYFGDLSQSRPYYMDSFAISTTLEASKAVLD